MYILRTDHIVYIRCSFQYFGALLLSNTAGNRYLKGRIAFFQVPEPAQATEKFLFSLFPDAARIEDQDIRILEGRWGPYISFKKGNYKIKKGADIQTLTAADCKLIIETEGTKPKTNKRRAK